MLLLPSLTFRQMKNEKYSKWRAEKLRIDMKPRPPPRPAPVEEHKDLILKTDFDSIYEVAKEINMHAIMFNTGREFVN